MRSEINSIIKSYNLLKKILEESHRSEELYVKCLKGAQIYLGLKSVLVFKYTVIQGSSLF